MADYRSVAEGDERLIRALATFDSWQITDAPYDAGAYPLFRVLD
jgi:hypothetical protein